MRLARDVAIVTALMMLGTWLLGWWPVPLIAALAAVLDRNQRASILKATVAASLAWALILLFQGLFGSSVTGFGRDLATSLGVPRALPLALTLVLPSVLAASAAGTVAGVKRLRARPRVSSTL